MLFGVLNVLFETLRVVILDRVADNDSVSGGGAIMCFLGGDCAEEDHAAFGWLVLFFNSWSWSNFSFFKTWFVF